MILAFVLETSSGFFLTTPEYLPDSGDAPSVDLGSQFFLFFFDKSRDLHQPPNDAHIGSVADGPHLHQVGGLCFAIWAGDARWNRARAMA
jgi:hypothetical protein